METVWMLIYFDVSCLNRPFDDQRQSRIRLEAEAVTWIIRQCRLGKWKYVSSEMVEIELDAIPDSERRNEIRALLPWALVMLELNEVVMDRAKELEPLGFKPADAVHVAASERLTADVLFSCDDRLIRTGRRYAQQLKVSVVNPLRWLEDIGLWT
jgi:predicted nucleic acid-binding protein